MLKSAVVEADSELARVKLQAQAYIVNKETARIAARSRSKLEDEKLLSSKNIDFVFTEPSKYLLKINFNPLNLYLFLQFFRSLLNRV